MSKLGDKIKEIRINEGLSQEAFAKELGYTSKSTINKIEKGINEISYLLHAALFPSRCLAQIIRCHGEDDRRDGDDDNG